MGGLAFKDKTRRIQRSEISKTLYVLGTRTDLSGLCHSSNLLGSALRSTDAGDLDLNVDNGVYGFSQVLSKLQQFLPADQIKARPAVGQIFTCVPILGKEENGFVQVDFMFGDYEWQDFSYYSAGNQMSKYKGLFRTELIKAAVAFHSNWTYFENDELVARVGPTLFHDRGIIWRYRHRPMRKDGRGRVQSFEVVGPTEFRKLFPDAPEDLNVPDFPIMDPYGVAKLLFRSTAESVVSSMYRYEDLHPLIRDTYDSESYATVMDLFEKRLNSLKVDIPKDILDEISTANSSAHATV